MLWGMISAFDVAWLCLLIRFIDTVWMTLQNDVLENKAFCILTLIQRQKRNS